MVEHRWHIAVECADQRGVWHVVEICFKDVREFETLERVQVQVLLRHIPGRMRPVDTDGDEPRATGIRQ